MAGHHGDQRMIHRRAARAHPLEVAPRFEATACVIGQIGCTVVPTQSTAAPKPSDDWLTFLFPPDDETTSLKPTVPVTTPRQTVPVPTTSNTPTPIVNPTTSTTAPAVPTVTSLSSTQPLLSTTSPSSTLPLPSTSTFFQTQTPAGALNSASSTPVAPSGGASTGKIVGFIGGGIVGFAVLAAVISFFLRRWRRRQQDNEAFNSADFRRSAVLLEDPPSHSDTVNAGFNPRPGMTERLARPPTFGTMYGATAPNYAQYATDHSPITENYANEYNTYAQDLPPSATSANPFFTPPVSPYPAALPASPGAGPKIFTRTSASSVGQVTLTRQASDRSFRGEEQAQPSSRPTSGTSDYVDLNRSTGLAQDNLSPRSPFEDQHGNPTPNTNRFSTASSQLHGRTEVLDFPAPPPSPPFRVDSVPPKLPEIHVGVASRSSELFSASTMGAYEFPLPPQPAALKENPAEARPNSVYDPDDVYGGI